VDEPARPVAARAAARRELWYQRGPALLHRDRKRVQRRRQDAQGARGGRGGEGWRRTEERGRRTEDGAAGGRDGCGREMVWR
jgi:hypothetical protein